MEAPSSRPFVMLSLIFLTSLFSNTQEMPQSLFTLLTPTLESDNPPWIHHYFYWGQLFRNGGLRVRCAHICIYFTYIHVNQKFLLITLFSVPFYWIFHGFPHVISTCSFYSENSGSQHQYIYSFAQSYKTQCSFRIITPLPLWTTSLLIRAPYFWSSFYL